MNDDSAPAADRANGTRKTEYLISQFEKEPNEFYETPPSLTEPLLMLEKFEGDIWEPACGKGAMSQLLTEGGHRVVSTDLIHRGYGEGGVNFLCEKQLRAPNVVTNPPFKLFRQFAQHALGLGARKVVLMNRMRVLGNVLDARLFERTGLARVHIAKGRVAILPPGATDKGHSPRDGNYAWFVWEAGYSGTPTVTWFSLNQQDGLGGPASSPSLKG